jgi:hypothetical protein
MEALRLDAEDPRALPLGTRIGPWRVVGFGDRGVFGIVYWAVRVGHEADGPVALKVAVYPRDPRFEREAWLLRNVRHPSVPRLLDAGQLRHASGFLHPYLVMEWVQGETLYAWAARRNPSSYQVMRLLAQGAWALHATHAIGAVHRDVSRIMRLMVHMGLRIHGGAGSKFPSLGGVQPLDGFAIQLEPADVPTSAALRGLKPPSLHPITHDGLGNVEALGDSVDGIEAVRPASGLRPGTGCPAYAE